MKQVVSWNKRDDRESILRLLQSEKVIAGHSDTVCGLFTLATPQGKKLLDQIKKRSNKPYLLLVSSLDKAYSYFDPKTRSSIEKLGNRYWPGPLTLVGRAHNDVPSYLTSLGTIAIRVPSHEGLSALLKRVPALFSTSANVAGTSVPLSIDTIDPALIAQVAAVVHDEPSIYKEPSTIVDCTGEQLRIIRPGAYTLKELTNTLSNR